MARVVRVVIAADVFLPAGLAFIEISARKHCQNRSWRRFLDRSNR